MVVRPMRSTKPSREVVNWSDDQISGQASNANPASLDQLRTFLLLYPAFENRTFVSRKFDGETASAADPFVKSSFRFLPPASTAERGSARAARGRGRSAGAEASGATLDLCGRGGVVRTGPRTPPET